MGNPRPLTVLVIDDDRVILDTFDLMLAELGYAALLASGQDQGIELFRQEHPDLALVDLYLENTCGFKVLQQIHEMSPETPVLIISGGGDIKDVIEALRGGAWDYLNKPINLSMLRHAISKALERARLLQEKRDYQAHLEEQVAQRTRDLRQAYAELVMANEHLANNEQRYRAIFENLQDVFFEILLDGTLLELSPSCRQLLDLPASELLEQNFWDYLIIEDEKYQLLQQLEKHGRVRNFELVLKSESDKVVPCSLVAKLHPASGGNPARICGTIRDVTDRKLAEARIKHLAYYDDLTDLPNRRLFSDRMAVSLSHARRHDRFGALLFIDLDNFKTINDSLGHLAGDQLLLQMAKRISEKLRHEDTLARLGGDEFVILLDDLGSNDLEAAKQARQAADKVQKTLGEPFEIDNHQLHISISIGISLFPAEQADVHELLQQADSAMYQAKEAGRNRICFFSPSMQQVANQRLTMEKDLRVALSQEQFLLHLQPQVDLAGEIIGAEVLLRWHHNGAGYVEPRNFIPVAETTGLIIPIGEWVLRRACSEFLKLKQAGLANQLRKVSINVSPRQFHQDDFVDKVRLILGETGMNPRLLQLELTEGVLISDLARTIKTMTALKNLGLRISIDDFGTGYSSLAYLKRLPLDELKIDKSFVHDIDSDDNAAAIVSAIIAMAGHLGLEVIAEGVETSSEFSSLQSKGGKVFQGYYFCRPVSALQFAQLLQTGPRSTNYPFYPARPSSLQ